MLMTRRKRKENKEFKIYLNNKTLLQVRSMKYWGIIFDHKLTFREQINYMAEQCTKLILSLSNQPSLTGDSSMWPSRQYTGAILPLLLYGAPVWTKAIEMESYKLKLKRVQTLINIKTAKAFRIVSNEAPCALTGLTPS